MDVMGDESGVSFVSPAQLHHDQASFQRVDQGDDSFHWLTSPFTATNQAMEPDAVMGWLDFEAGEAGQQLRGENIPP